MRFVYTYRTSDNVLHEDVISAPSREDVFRRLKEKGIRPGRVNLAPGFLNHLFGNGKRWLAIIVLGALCLVLTSVLLFGPRGARDRDVGVMTAKSLPRQQIERLPPDWIEQLPRFFPSSCDAYLALYAQPGYFPPAPSGARQPPSTGEAVFGEDILAALPVSPSDPEWVADLKRIVAGMKVEAAQLHRAGKSDGEIALWLSERQRMERDYRNQLEGRVRRKELSLDEANGFLRAVGLKTLPFSDR